jgi:hypothetical protein
MKIEALLSKLIIAGERYKIVLPVRVTMYEGLGYFQKPDANILQLFSIGRYLSKRKLPRMIAK